MLEAINERGVEIESLCGGIRICGKCIVKLIKEGLSPFGNEEGKFIIEV